MTPLRIARGAALALVVIVSACRKEPSFLDEPITSSIDVEIHLVRCMNRYAPAADRQRCRDGEAWKQYEYVLQEFRDHPDDLTANGRACEQGEIVVEHFPSSKERHEIVRHICCDPPFAQSFKKICQKKRDGGTPPSPAASVGD